MKISLLKKCLVFLFTILTITLLSIPFFNNTIQLIDITSHEPYRPEWEISSLKNDNQSEVYEILEQPFYYLSEGGQTIVFSSADDRYVLKLFKFNRFRPYYFIKILPDIFPFKQYKDKHIITRNQKLITAFNGHKLAYDLHHDESGLIFIQLNSSNSSKTVVLIDKDHHKIIIPLSNVSFVLQKKGEVLSENFSKILNRGNIQIAKKRIDQLFDLYLSEYQKGIHDLDHGVMHNIGCIDNELFHLDVGKFIQDDLIKNPTFYKKDLIKIALKLDRWITTHYPQYSEELQRYMEKDLSDIFGEKFQFRLFLQTQEN